MESITSRRLHEHLPVFALESGRRSVIYVPGHVAPGSQTMARNVEAHWRNGGTVPGVGELAAQLECLARGVIERWKAARSEPFRPECLNLQLGYACNLACPYCYSRSRSAGPLSEGKRPPQFNEAFVACAAKVVADCCVGLGKPFHFVVQGRGEPTMQWEHLCQLVGIARRVARGHGLTWFGHATTNGQCSEPQLAWLAEHFQSIALSCDGPPELQNVQRPRRDGGRSSSNVERAARFLARSGSEVEVRATVVPSGIVHIAELVEYVGRVLGISKLRVEPAFRFSDQGFRPELVEDYAREFQRAGQRAAVLGMELSFSGVRLNELHGPFCEVARNALRLFTDGRAVNCVCEGHGSLVQESTIGRYDAVSDTFRVDQEAAAHWKQLALDIPHNCRDCFNQFHCERTCPEICPWSGPPSAAGDFRCLLQQRLAREWIWRAAYPDPGESDTSPGAEIAPAKAVNEEALQNQLAELPDTIDTARITDERRRASARYNLEQREMPLPPWAHKGFDLTGEQAWDVLREQAERNSHKALSIYIHVPFCRQHCGFCDCHSFPTNGRWDAEYVRLLIQHLRLWSEQTALKARPVTTIHFGGGTPNAMQDGCLNQLVAACRDLFSVSRKTELAIETTGAFCGPEELSRLMEVGFTRLHVGVQTLDAGLRQAIGRQTLPAELLTRLKHSMHLGFITSVDLIYGLPGQRISNLVQSLLELIGMGIHGISLYHLNSSEKNLLFLRRLADYRTDPVADFVMLHCAEQILLQHGYSKNHFVHYARPADQNLYFCHPLRGEDLLAVGASAAGTMGCVNYRYCEFPAFRKRASLMADAFEGVVLPASHSERLFEVVASLMCARLSRPALAAIGAQELFEVWDRSGLIRACEESNRYTLTPTGSWLLNTMLNELRSY